MIRLYDADESQFNHEETVLTALSCVVTEEENGAFFLHMETAIDERVQVGKIVKASTPRGEQLFRINAVKKKLDKNKRLYEISAAHIFYDLLDNLVLNVRPTDATAINALQAILNGAEEEHEFIGWSDVQGTHTANYVRVNPIQAIMGNQENALLNLWGGYLKRDNFEIKVHQTPLDRGYEVRFGKNLIGVEQSIDTADVVTRIYPTVVIEGNIVTALPEKYVDSPIIGQYPKPIIRELRINLTDEEKLLPIEQIYQLMRDRSGAHFTADADKPKINYKVNFVQLRKTEQYKDLAILEELDISDTVHVAIGEIGISLDARVIKYTWDSLRERFLGIELGNFKPKLTNQNQKVIELIEKIGEEITDGKIAAALKDAIDRITGHRGGYRYDLFNPDGQPSGTAYMDTDDINTAQNYILINNQGVAFGDSGLSNPPSLAISIDGSIVGESALFDSLVTNLIQSDIGQSLDLSSNVSINQIVTNQIDDFREDVNVQFAEQSSQIAQTSQEITTAVEQVTGYTDGQVETLRQEQIATASSWEISLTEIREQQDLTDEDIQELMTYLRYSGGVLELGESGSPMTLQLTNEQMQFLESGAVVMYINGRKVYVDSLEVLSSIIIGAHLIEKYQIDGVDDTIVRKV